MINFTLTDLAFLTNVYYSGSALVPIMTSNTTPSGVVSSSDASSTAYQAFTPALTDGWVSGIGGAYIQYQFPIAKTVNQIFVAGGIGAGASNPVITIIASNNGTTFVTVGSFIIHGSSPSTFGFTIGFSNINPYLYYRLITPNGTSITFDAIQYYGF